MRRWLCQVSFDLILVYTDAPGPKFGAFWAKYVQGLPQKFWEVDIGIWEEGKWD
jgi:hypothetical protein